MKKQKNGEADNLNRVIDQNKERLKELAAINQTTALIKEGKSIEETLQRICSILPNAWQYPDFAVAKITYGDYVCFSNARFRESIWSQKQFFETIDIQKGSIEIFYLEKFPYYYEGPFLKEERDLIDNLANIICSFINSYHAKTFYQSALFREAIEKKDVTDELIPPSSKQLLQRYLNKHNMNRDIFHDMMPFKVKEILLIATLYDAYSIEKEGRFSEHILGEYYQLNLTSIPRITGVSTYEEVSEQLNRKQFDMIIIMVGVDKKFPQEISSKIKEKYSYIPIFLLLNNNSDLALYEDRMENISCIDKLFVWNGESKIFFAMVKHLEDKINLENDTKIGLVRIILLVEDSAKYYSRYLPLLYTNVMEQTRLLIEEVSTDELYKVLRLRARPRIIMVSNYEDALFYINHYYEHLLCVITDVRFEREKTIDDKAGFLLVQYLRKLNKDLPIIVQSYEHSNAEEAYRLNTVFINKDSETLAQDINSFINHYLGFGNFIYKNSSGKEIAVAKSLKEFENLLKIIPDESIRYHAERNHFSLWLRARGEIEIAKIINPLTLEDFKSTRELRECLLNYIRQNRYEQDKGKLIPFDETTICDETNVASLASGSLGGKGRGLAFINTLIHHFDFSKIVSNINIKTPCTSIIGTDEFEYFMKSNHLYEFLAEETDFHAIKKRFLQSILSESLKKKIKALLKKVSKPLAFRSSGLFEDSLNQPFAGIFDTYLLPNNHPDIKVRIEQALSAIKLVYASLFSDKAKAYIEAVNYKMEEEKMAVVIQEVVGNDFDGYFYPHISGVAQSFNFYPYAHMKPEEGFVVLALGLGKYVVDGERAYRFSPRYPNIEFTTPKEQYKNSQTSFYAVNLKKKNVNLLLGEDAGLIKLDTEIAEKNGTLKHLASVFDFENERIVAGIEQPGPRVLNFANILHYKYIPLSETIEAILDVVKEALGSPVEIEFAVDLTRDENNRSTFYLLQIKPMIGNLQDYKIDLEGIQKDKLILFAEKAMGNGVIEDITDVVFVDKESFDKSKTMEMSLEVEEINRQMMKENRKYILIGPGRWGTRDKWIGIPVNWPQISAAGVIVETSFEDFPLDASLGSHFFHNVISHNIVYLSAQHNIDRNLIDWNNLNKQRIIRKMKYFKQVRFDSPVTVKVDGKKRIAVITIA